MIIIKNGIVLMGHDLQPQKANMLVENGKIMEITNEKLLGSEIIDATGCIVSPSLINSHVHIGDAIAPDIGDGQNIAEIVKPPHGLKHQILRESSAEDMITAMRDAMWEMLVTGTTTFVDYREGGLEGIHMLDDAAKDVPINKVVLGRHDIFLDPGADLSEVRNEVKKLLKSCDGIAPSGFGEIRDEVAQIICEECRKQGKLSSIHVAEYQEVQQESVKSTGKSEVQRALDEGFQLLVHLTSPLNGDLKKVRANGNSVVCCPRSNGTLAVGIPPLKDMVDKGINTLLGTDNLMFNSPNMFREMEYALKVTRGYEKQYFGPKNVLKMATTNAHHALEMDSGIIAPGKTADIMIVKKMSQNPWLSIINRTESKNIICLMRQGKIVYKR
jgi:cytosine/adenosine deaminase-related metal-dependent hydrolase